MSTMKEQVVRVLPDVSGLNKAFDYSVPNDLSGPPIRVGTIVRVSINGRRTAGWVVGVDTEPPEGVKLEPLLKASSFGPLPEVVDLAEWVAKEWAGRWSAVLGTASPEPYIHRLPGPSPAPVAAGPAMGAVSLFDGSGPRVVRSAPASDRFEIVRAAAALGPAIVIAPDHMTAARYAGRLARAGVRTHRFPQEWAGGFTGGVVLGARSAAFASVPDLASIVVIDEHDDGLINERNPTWNARDVAIERASRAGIPCLLVSASPSPAVIHRVPDVRLPDRSAERQGWPIVQVVDRRDDDPGRGGLFTGALSRRLREGGRALCILNRKGRSVMMACAVCGELIRTQDRQELMVELDGKLVARRSGESRPLVCAECGSTKLKRLRLGVTKVAEELSVLLREPVGEVTGTSAGGEGLDNRVVVGTEALLHRVASARTVAFLDFDNELLAPRYRAAEQAMALLLRACTIVGPRADGGRVLVQTRSPNHRVLQAAMKANPEGFTSSELELRAHTNLPPFGGLAQVGGTGSDAFVEPLRERLGLEVVGPDSANKFLVKGPDRATVAAALSAIPRPKDSRVSVAVDPPRA
ncbi:MAG: hypothetical protein HKN03_00170 [Acidimicrobiales bacterium]|nr:hypothetical protein [Acidimicrobiales bacterium]